MLLDCQAALQTCLVQCRYIGAHKCPIENIERKPLTVTIYFWNVISLNTADCLPNKQAWTNLKFFILYQIVQSIASHFWHTKKLPLFTGSTPSPPYHMQTNQQVCTGGSYAQILTRLPEGHWKPRTPLPALTYAGQLAQVTQARIQNELCHSRHRLNLFSKFIKTTTHPATASKTLRMVPTNKIAQVHAWRVPWHSPANAEQIQIPPLKTLSPLSFLCS